MTWLVELAVGALALVGLWVTLDKAAVGVAGVWRWAWRDRVTPLLDDDRVVAGKCEACWAENDGEGCDWAMCGCACHDDDALEELPPERSEEELGFTGPRTLMGPAERAFWSELDEFGPYGMLRAERERRAPPWEAFQRIQYEAMGFEFPSGLMARVRELTP